VSDEISPYAAPTAAAAGLSPLLLQAPPRIKVIGLLNVVLSSLGLFLLVYSLNLLTTRERQLVEMESQGRDQTVRARQIRELDEVFRPTLPARIASSLVLNALSLAAGVALLKRRRVALKISNISNLATVLANGVVLAWYLGTVIPEMERIYGDTITQNAAITTTALMLAGPVLCIVFGGGSLLLLNQARVRESLV